MNVCDWMVYNAMRIEFYPQKLVMGLLLLQIYTFLRKKTS